MNTTMRQVSAFLATAAVVAASVNLPIRVHDLTPARTPTALFPGLASLAFVL